MKSICLFAGYDKNGKIDDYVIYYIKELSNFCDVYYMGDFDTSEIELKKLSPYTKEAIAYRHGRYDYGSWDELIKKIGWDKIQEYDQLILANDSCYGPLYPFSEVFEEMKDKDCDFWGLSCGKGYHIHIQSYFLVFRKNVLKTDYIKLFLSNVKCQKSLKDVCELYEDQFTYYLKKNGFSYSSYIPYGEFKVHPYYETWRCIKEKRFPLLKVKVFDGVVGYDYVKSWKNFIKNNTKYDYKLIVNNLHNRGYIDKDIDLAVNHWQKRSKLKNCLNRIKKLPRKIVKKLLSPFWKKYINRINRESNYNRVCIENSIYKLNESVKSLEQKIKFYPCIMNDKRNEDEILDYFYKYGLIRKSDLFINVNKKIKVKGEDKLSKSTNFISDELVVDYLQFNSFMFKFKSIPMFRKSNQISILLCGNIYENIAMQYLLGNPNIILLNNDYIRQNTLEARMFNDAGILYKTDLLTEFAFYVSNNGEKNDNKKAIFDLIIVNEFSKNVTDGEIISVLYNFGKNMIDESILIISIPHGAQVMNKFDDILDEVNFYWNHEYQELLEPFFINMDSSNCFVLMKK